MAIYHLPLIHYFFIIYQAHVSNSMPVVLGLDVSLSMGRLIKTESSSEEISRKHLAIGGLNHLLDLIGANLKLEFTSLV